MNFLLYGLLPELFAQRHRGVDLVLETLALNGVALQRQEHAGRHRAAVAGDDGAVVLQQGSHSAGGDSNLAVVEEHDTYILYGTGHHLGLHLG